MLGRRSGRTPSESGKANRLKGNYMDADILIMKLKLVRPDTPVYLFHEEHKGTKTTEPLNVSLAIVEHNEDGKPFIKAFPSSPGFEYNAVIIS